MTEKDKDQKPLPESVEKYHPELYKLNPTLSHFTRLVYYGQNEEDIKKKLLLELEKKYNCYYRLNSNGTVNNDDIQNNAIFIFEYEYVKYDSGVPVSINKYFIAFAVCKDVAVGGLKFNDFYDAYFLQPTKAIIIDLTKCSSTSDCNPSFAVNKDRWCKRCLGNAFVSNITAQMMKKSFSFSDMPKESIIYIDKTVTPIKQDDIEILSKAMAITKKEIATVKDFNADIDVVTKKITSIIETYMADTEAMRKYLVNYGNSLETFNEHTNALRSMYKAAKTNKKIETLLKKKADMEEKLANLNSKIDELRK